MPDRLRPARPPTASGRLRRRPALADAAVLVGAPLLAGLIAVAVLRLLTFHPDVLPALAVAVPVAFLLATRPRLIAPAFVALAWTLVGERVLGEPDPIAIASLVLVAAGTWLALRRLELTIEPFVVGALLAVPMLAAGLLSSAGPRIDLDQLADVSFLLVAALALPRVHDLWIAGLALALAGVALGAGAVFSVLGEPTSLFPVTAHGTEPAAGPIGDPQQFALSLSALVPFAGIVATSGGNVGRTGAAALVCLFAGLVAAGSIGALLLAVAGLVALTLVRRHRLGGAALGLATLVALVVAALPAQAGSATKRFVQPSKSDASVALDMFRDHPLVGVGPGRYPDLYDDYVNAPQQPLGIIGEPRNLPLQLAAEQGLFGLVCWFGAGWVVLRAALRRRIWRTELGRALLVSTGVYLAGSLFLSAGEFRPLFLLAGLTLALGGALPRALPPFAR